MFYLKSDVLLLKPPVVTVTPVLSGGGVVICSIVTNTKPHKGNEDENVINDTKCKKQKFFNYNGSKTCRLKNTRHKEEVV